MAISSSPRAVTILNHFTGNWIHSKEETPKTKFRHVTRRKKEENAP